MNVQFSLPVSTSSPISHQADLTSHVEQTREAVNLGSINDMKELNRLVTQGSSFSIGEEQLIKTIDRAVKSLQGPETVLDISIHEKTHDIMVKVLNKNTGEIIREVPPEKTLDLVAKMMEIAGILIDKKV